MPRTATAPTLEQRLLALEQRMAHLETQRPGRRPKPFLVIKQHGVCALDPGRDSSECPDASIYRYQMGCHGDSCRLKQHEAYERRKNGIEVPKARQRVTKKTSKPATKTKVTKRVSKRQAS